MKKFCYFVLFFFEYILWILELILINNPIIINNGVKNNIRNKDNEKSKNLLKEYNSKTKNFLIIIVFVFI